MTARRCMVRASCNAADSSTSRPEQDGPHTPSQAYRRRMERLPGDRRGVRRAHPRCEATAANDGAPTTLNGIRMIRRFTIEGFKRFEQKTVIDLDGVNVLVGANNSGKSTILHALTLFQYCVRDDPPDEWQPFGTETACPGAADGESRRVRCPAGRRSCGSLAERARAHQGPAESPDAACGVRQRRDDRLQLQLDYNRFHIVLSTAGPLARGHRWTRDPARSHLLGLSPARGVPHPCRPAGTGCDSSAMARWCGTCCGICASTRVRAGTRSRSS